MGNGPGITTVTSTSLTVDDIEQAAQISVSNFGTPNNIFISPQWLTNTGFTWHMNPEFEGLPWSSINRLTKREYRTAALHMFLFKMKLLNQWTEEDHNNFQIKACKRLKRAKWSKKRKIKKVQSPK